jgi:hypothetical protein
MTVSARGGLGAAELDAAVPSRPRACAVCGASLEGRRRDAETCSATCRIERSRIRRLLAGRTVEGYPSWEAYQGRQRRTNPRQGTR